MDHSRVTQKDKNNKSECLIKMLEIKCLECGQIYYQKKKAAYCPLCEGDEHHQMIKRFFDIH